MTERETGGDGAGERFVYSEDDNWLDTTRKVGSENRESLFKVVEVEDVVDAYNIQATELRTLRAQLAEYEDKLDWNGCNSGDCPHETAQECAVALGKFLAAETSQNESLRADKARVDWLEGEKAREAGPFDSDCERSLFRRNQPITRETIDAARVSDSDDDAADSTARPTENDCLCKSPIGPTICPVHPDEKLFRPTEHTETKTQQGE